MKTASPRKRAGRVLLAALLLVLAALGAASAVLYHRVFIQPQNTYFSQLNVFSKRIFDLDETHVTGFSIRLYDIGCGAESAALESRDPEEISRLVDALNAYRFFRWNVDDFRPTHSSSGSFVPSSPRNARTKIAFFMVSIWARTASAADLACCSLFKRPLMVETI